ncbi:MAG TPA: acyl-CoA dehydrogenase family protein [Acidimicrobiales bacterium]|nr:acyl-CoA dehydrogenase family protein [Acidimicrobiales bacterium]
MPPDLDDFRLRAREWLSSHAPRQKDDGDGDDALGVPGEDEQASVMRAQKLQGELFEAGLAGITWPVEYGGQGLTVAHQIAFDEQASHFELGLGNTFTITFGMCGPTILACGTVEQKRRYIAPMLRGEEIWSQLFSEPGAGSDVAGLQSRAVRDGDEWVLNGQKVWTSGAHYSSFGLVVARTDVDVPKHQGITMFILDMHLPGVTIRPLRQMTGGAHFNEVFFDQVRIPADCVVGEVNGGWRAAVTTLMNERVSIGAGGRASTFEPLLALAHRHGRVTDAVIRQRLADVYIRERVLDYIGQRIRSAVMSGAVPGPQGSIAKLAVAQLTKRGASLGVDLLGCRGTAWEPGDEPALAVAARLLASPGSSIAGGTDEVLKNIVGERVLGLPKEPQVDRDIPFREVAANAPVARGRPLDIHSGEG